jgi:hypothetical protein
VRREEREKRRAKEARSTAPDIERSWPDAPDGNDREDHSDRNQDVCEVIGDSREDGRKQQRCDTENHERSSGSRGHPGLTFDYNRRVSRERDSA